MNKAVLKDVRDRSFAKTITFPEVVSLLRQEGVESYHVDFLRNEYTYYARNGESFTTEAPFVHDPVAATFSAEKIDALNKRVQSGQAWYPDFVKEGTAAGCAYYIVYLFGNKVRYLGRDGDEHIQYFPRR